MAITTVTNKGKGAAGGVKGPGNNRNFFVPQSTPHIVASGTVTLATGAATVVFPHSLPEAASKYNVMLTVVAAAGAAHEVSLVSKTDTDGLFASFAVAGAGASDVVQWTVVKNGFGLEA